MVFFETFNGYRCDYNDITEKIRSTSKRNVDRVLNQVESGMGQGEQGSGMCGHRLSIDAFAALLSSEASAPEPLERMAQVAHGITRHHFGNAIFLFTPMYISNYCNNGCVYCGFQHSTGISRHRMSLEEVRIEAEKIAESGIKHILILTGDAPQKASVSYIRDCCEVLRPFFSSISIEVFALTVDEYAMLVDAGVDGLTLFQETYNEALYRTLHPIGPKKDFRFRIEAPERGAMAGMRNVNIGALLGLDAWENEVFFTALHARWLEERFPEVDISISLPRMRPHAGSYQPACTVSDRDMVQIMTALRIFLPRCGITISTRENACFRNHILKLGVTKVSAGVTTAVGGHTATKTDERTPQFEISDSRSVAEMTSYLKTHGLQPVFKDWERF